MTRDPTEAFVSSREEVGHSAGGFAADDARAGRQPRTPRRPSAGCSPRRDERRATASTSYEALLPEFTRTRPAARRRPDAIRRSIDAFVRA